MIGALLGVALVVASGTSPPRHKYPKPGSVPVAEKPFSYDFSQPQRIEVGGTGPTRVTALHQVPMPVWGYGILLVSIDNSTGPSQTLRLRYQSTAGGGQRSVERAVELRAGERQQLALPIPAGMRYGKLVARGAGIQNATEPGVYFTYAYRPQRIVLSIGSPEEFEKVAGQRPVNTDPAVLVTPIAPQDAPSELAGYVGYDAVAVSSGPIESLPPHAQRALEAYAATGGVLILGEVGRGTAELLPLLGVAQSSGGVRDYGFGSVSMDQTPGQREALYFSAEPVVNPQGVRPSYSRRGFGNGAGVDDVLLPQALAPLGRFMIIIVLFTLAIGPGSWWVAKKRGPGALLVTIPATAFVTCGLIIGYSLIRDGFTVHASVHGYSLLDAPRNRVITSAVGAFYANLAPSKAVFPSSTAIIAPWEQNVEGQQASITWGEGARFGSDFLPSRSYREWAVLGVEPTRARLVLKQDGEALKVQNALGSRIAVVRVTWHGQDWEAHNLRDGGEAKLEKATQSGPPDLEPKASGRFDSDAQLRARGGVIADGEFVALLEGPAFAPLGGLSLSQHESAHVVRGAVTQ